MRIAADLLHRSDNSKRASARLLRLVWISLCLCTIIFSATADAAASWNASDVLTAYLKEHYPWFDVSVSDIRLQGATPAAAPTGVNVEKAPPGTMVFTLEFQDSKSVRGSAFVKAFDQVMMSRGSFNRGYTLREQDVYSVLMETGRMPRGAVRDADLVVGRTLVRSVMPNAPLTDAMISDSAVLKRGRKVSLLAVKDGFSIKAAGELKQDASVGDYVRALNLQSKKTVTGYLINDTTVRVEF